MYDQQEMAEINLNAQDSFAYGLQTKLNDATKNAFASYCYETYEREKWNN